MKKLFLTGLAILGLGFVTVPMSAKAQTTAAPTTNPTTPSNTTNNGSSMKKPRPTVTPRSTVRSRSVTKNRRTRAGGDGGTVK